MGVNPLISKTVTLAGSPGTNMNGGIYFGPEYELSSASAVTIDGDGVLDGAVSPFNVDIVGTVRKAGTATARVMGPLVVLYTGSTSSGANSSSAANPGATDMALGALDFLPKAKSRLVG